MSEHTSLQKDYAKYRIEKAKEDLTAAKLLYDNGSYRIAILCDFSCIKSSIGI